jgi:hypothetical protein
VILIALIVLGFIWRRRGYKNSKRRESHGQILEPSNEYVSALKTSGAAEMPKRNEAMYATIDELKKQPVKVLTDSPLYQSQGTLQRNPADMHFNQPCILSI